MLEAQKLISNNKIILMYVKALQAAKFFRLSLIRKKGLIYYGNYAKTLSKS